MKRILLASAFVIAIAGAFASKSQPNHNGKLLVAAWYKAPSCTSAGQQNCVTNTNNPTCTADIGGTTYDLYDASGCGTFLNKP
jgi:hypothetical protein